jgi:hypothetical protein
MAVPFLFKKPAAQGACFLDFPQEAGSRSGKSHGAAGED